MSPQDAAATSIAATDAAASPTPKPTNTPVPTDTPEPTETPEPTATEVPTATDTPEPSATPTPEGPLKLTDDFSTELDIWGDCDACEWSDGGLFMGPFNIEEMFWESNYMVCEGCGEPVGYRMAVDVTFVDGQTDRGYGLLMRRNSDEAVMLEITPFQTLLVWQYDFKLNQWDLLNRSSMNSIIGMVKAGKQTNHIEVEYRPSSSGNLTADVYVNVNGRNAFVLYNRSAKPGQVGLEMGFHSQQVVFDNFEFEELVAEAK